MMAITSAPRLYWASSEASGRFTLMTMSASFNASALTVAPAAVNSESGRPDLMPAPGSIAISTPRALNFFTVSGDAATRGSDGSISLATAIFMGLYLWSDASAPLVISSDWLQKAEIASFIRAKNLFGVQFAISSRGNRRADAACLKPSSLDLISRHQQVDPSLFDRQPNAITIPDESQRSARSRVRRDVQDDRAERRAAHPRIRQTDHVFDPLRRQLLGDRQIARFRHAGRRKRTGVLQHQIIVGVDV